MKSYVFKVHSQHCECIGDLCFSYIIEIAYVYVSISHSWSLHKLNANLLCRTRRMIHWIFLRVQLNCGCSDIFISRKSAYDLLELPQSITSSPGMPLEKAVSEVRLGIMPHYQGLLLPLYNGNVHQKATPGYFCCKTVYHFPTERWQSWNKPMSCIEIIV